MVCHNRHLHTKSKTLSSNILLATPNIRLGIGQCTKELLQTLYHTEKPSINFAGQSIERTNRDLAINFVQD